MKIALLYGRWCLSFRGSLDFEGYRDDPRGLTGSEYGFIRCAEELARLGHEVHIYSVGAGAQAPLHMHSIDDAHEIDVSFDAAVSFNEPELLRDCKAKLRACQLWLNSFEYNKLGFDEHIDLWFSPSEAHRQMVLGQPHAVEVIHSGPRGYYRAKPEQWVTIPLGCDPQNYPETPKVSGRVIYASSPDRGLHLLLQEWPAIKRAVPHATLRIFYRLQAWINGFDNIGYSPAIEELRSRALYINEALRRMSGPDWGIEVCDSVSRARIEREMCEAEVLAYPCDTTRWSEGFSCAILEACAARACPVIFDTDALGEIYGGTAWVSARGNIEDWCMHVIMGLVNAQWRDDSNQDCRALAEKLTWTEHAVSVAEALRTRSTK